jgi:hypothetical protein
LRRPGPRSIVALHLVLALLSVIGGFIGVGAHVGTIESTPQDARHCSDSVGPMYHDGCWELPLLSAPADGATIGSTPTLFVTVQTTNGSPPSPSPFHVSFVLCSNSTCSAQIQSGSDLGNYSNGQMASWTPTALSTGTYYWYAYEWESLWNNQSPTTAIQSFTIGAGANAPNPPTALAQFESNGTTALAGGSFAGSNTVVLKFNVSDPNASQTITPWVEVRRNTSFQEICGTTGVWGHSGAPVSAPVASTSYPASVTVSGLSDGPTYYWRACGVDQSSNIGTWTPRGGTPDFGIDIGNPVSPSQSQIYDLSTTFANDRDATMSATALSTSWDPGWDLGSGVLNYDACFSTVSTGCTPIAGTAMVGAVTTGQATATATGMTNLSTYYSCVRARDNRGFLSPWQCSDGFTVNTAGVAPGVTLVAPAANAWTNARGPTVQVQYDDPDGQDGTIRVEFCQTAAADPWTVNCPSGYSSVQTAAGAVTAGATATLTSNGSLPDGTAYWRASSVDSGGLASGWTAARPIQVDATAPTPVPTVTLVRHGRGKIDVTYAAATDALNAPVTYDVEAYDNTGGTWTSLCAATSVLTCTKSGLGGTELFETRVRACDSIGNCTAWSGAGGVANSGYLLRNLTSLNLNNVQSRKAQLGAAGAQDATTTGISLPSGGAANRIGSFPLRYNTTVSAKVVLDTTAPIDPQDTTMGRGWVIDDVEGKSLPASDIEVEVATIPTAGTGGTGVGAIRCRAWKVLTNGSNAMVSWTYLGEATGDVADVMTAAGAGTTSSSCTITNAIASQTAFANNEVLYVEPIIEATTAGASADGYKLVFNDASSSIDIRQPGTPPSTAVLVSPPNAAVTSTQPTLTAQYVHPTPVNGRIELQYSTDPTFATGVTTLTSNDLVGGASASLQPGTTLPTGTTWYWRARGVDTSDLVGPWSASRSFVISSPPSEPVPASPANAATVSPGAVVFTSSAFSDPNGGDTHAASEWQVIPLGGSWASPVATSGVTATSLTSWTSPALPAGDYEWRVRYRDSFGVWSVWSGTTPANARTLTLSTGSLTLSPSATTVPLGLQTVGIDTFGSSTITVVASNATGYTLYASDESDADGAFCACGTNVPDWSGTGATPTAWTTGTSGYVGITVRSATGGRLAKWGTGTGTAQTDVVNNKFAGLRSSQSVVLHSRASATAGDPVVTTWRMDVGVGQANGTYSTQTTLTLVANP